MLVRDQFYAHLQDHLDRAGCVLPPLLSEYLVDLMAARLDRVDIIPDPSFAERYLQLYTEPRVSEIVDYADSALFFCSLMPEYGRRRGLSMDYYATLGISSYYAAGDLASDHRYTQLGNWFYTLQQILAAAVKPYQQITLVSIYKDS